MTSFPAYCHFENMLRWFYPISPVVIYIRDCCLHCCSAHDYKTMFIPAFAIGARLFTVAWGSGEYGDSFLNDERTPTGKGQVG